MQARLDGYLTQAEQRLGEGQLLQPEDDSATYYFRQVLAWEPDNLLALAGLDRIAQRFIERSEAAYGRREFADALAYIEQGLEVAPNNETLLQLRADHQRRTRVAQAPRPASKARSTSTARTSDAPAARQNPIKRLWNNLFND